MQRISTAKLSSLQQIAIQATHASGRVLLRRFRKKLTIKLKLDLGLVTNADLESEKAALKILNTATPDFSILTEESAEKKKAGPGRWILDPLDGTTNYAHGFSNFCVSLAAEWNGEVVVGVIHHPISGDTYSAMKGKGAKLNGKKISVSQTKKLNQALLSTGFCSQKDRWLKEEIKAFEHLSSLASGIRRPGSAALDLAHVALGVFDGYWERGLAPWDVAAGTLLIQEAGGKVSNFSGTRLKLDAREIVASNGFLHQNLVRELGL